VSPWAAHGSTARQVAAYLAQDFFPARTSFQQPFAVGGERQTGPGPFGEATNAGAQDETVLLEAAR